MRISQVQLLPFNIENSFPFAGSCIGIVPGKPDIVIKLLSVDPTNYDDAPTEGIRRILEIATGETIPRGKKLDTSRIGNYT